jgi:hypothetical protein
MLKNKSFATPAHKTPARKMGFAYLSYIYSEVIKPDNKIDE